LEAVSKHSCAYFKLAVNEEEHLYRSVAQILIRIRCKILTKKNLSSIFTVHEIHGFINCVSCLSWLEDEKNKIISALLMFMKEHQSLGRCQPFTICLC